MNSEVPNILKIAEKTKLIQTEIFNKPNNHLHKVINKSVNNA